MFARIDGRLNSSLDMVHSPRLLAFYRVAFAAVFLSEYMGSLMPFSIGLARGAVGAVIFVCMVGVLIGFYARIMAFLGGLVFIYCVIAWGWFQNFQLLHHHHPFLIGWIIFLFSFCSCEDRYSLVRSFRANESTEKREPVRSFLPVLSILKLQTLVIYFFAILSKMRPDYLSGFRLQQAVLNTMSGSISSRLFGHDDLALVLALLSAGVELGLFVALLFGRTRRWAAYGFILFHLTIAVIFPVGTFTAMMPLLLTLFLPEETILGWLDGTFF